MMFKRLRNQQPPERVANPVIRRDDVIAAYRLLLGREPESEAAIEFHSNWTSAADLIRAIATSPEFSDRRGGRPDYSYNGTLDAEAIIRSHENKERKGKFHHVVNFLGVAISYKFLPMELFQETTVEELPIPANWHADMAEFGAALRAVDLARNRFSMIELGCGWGCWMNITGVAARRRGMDVRVTGVEGDPNHIAFARQTLATNGIAEDAYFLKHGIAGSRPGVALFPKHDDPQKVWGLEPKFDASEDEHAKLLEGGLYEELPVIGLGDLIGEEPRIDLLHMDIQGGEANLVRECMEMLVDKVAYLVIGTHSRAIEGQLMTDLLEAGWILEIERPSRFMSTQDGLATTVDGIQGWRNPHLAPA